MKKVLVLLLMLVLFSSMFVTGCQKQKRYYGVYPSIQEFWKQSIVEQEEQVEEDDTLDAAFQHFYKESMVEQEEQVEEVVEQILETKVVDAEIEQEADR